MPDICDGRFFHGLSAAFVLSWIAIYVSFIFQSHLIANVGVILAGTAVGLYFLRIVITKPFSRGKRINPPCNDE